MQYIIFNDSTHHNSWHIIVVTSCSKWYIGGNPKQVTFFYGDSSVIVIFNGVNNYHNVLHGWLVDNKL